MKNVHVADTTYADLKALAKRLNIPQVDDLVNIICTEVLYHATRATRPDQQRTDHLIDQEAVKKRLSDLGYL